MSNSSKELVKQIQGIGYQILCDVDIYCSKNNLSYYLSGGTCLGAVRNHGFIPWDDDVDIMLPRKDYEKFLKNFEQSYEGKYKLECFDSDENWGRTYARIWDLNTELIQTKLKEVKMGIFVDVFPIDGMPQHTISQNIFMARLKFLNVLRNASIRTNFYDYEKFRIIKRLLGIFTKPFGARFFALRMDKLARKYSFEEAEYVGVSLAVHYWMREKIERENMASGIRVPFESGEFPIPIGYDKYLKNLYGDYMEIPKDAEEKGYSHLDGWKVKIKDNDSAER